MRINYKMTSTKNKYSLPFYRKDLIVTVSDPRAHFAHFKDAIDFVLPEGVKIIASLDGVVVDLKQDSNEGGADPKYNDPKFVNYLTIEHINGEFSQYVHLKYKSITVKVGDKIKSGQVIALSGNTGFSTTPHLHFLIFKLNKTKEGWESLNPRFNEKINIDRKIKSVPKHLKKTIEELERVKKNYLDE
jgi:murein DD-endopeptidase MepM/ murein hydrolase activator NlpD